MKIFAPNLWRQHWLWLTLAVLFGFALFWLRFLPAGQTRFALDESLYGGIALQITHGNPFMQNLFTDKPPLLFYLMAASFQLFGASELTARLPNVILGVLTLLPLWGIARRLYPSQPAVALLACGLFALSPLAQVYAPTAYTDPVMAFGLLVSVWLAGYRRWFWAGILLGLAVCAKQQAVFFAPFPVLVALLVVLWDGEFNPAIVVRQLVRLIPRLVLGTILPFLVVTLFDNLRGQISSFIQGAVTNSDRLGLVAPSAWPARLSEWWSKVLQYFFVPEPFGLLVLALVLVYGGWVLWRLWRVRFYFPADTRKENAVEGFGRLSDLALFAAFIIVLLWHTVQSYPIWDRYLLPMVPFAALLVARSLVWLAGFILPKWGKYGWKVAGLALVVFAFMVVPLAQAESGKLPLGGDYLAFQGVGQGAHDAYAGIDQLALFFKTVPSDSYVVHERMGWDFSYYLFGLPLQLPPDLTYPLDPQDIIDFTDHSDSVYVVFADWQQASYQTLSGQLTALHYHLEDVYEIRPTPQRVSFTVYRLTKV